MYRYAQADEMMHMNRNNTMMIIQSHYHMQVLGHEFVICLVKFLILGVGLK